MTDTNAREAAIDEAIAKTHSALFTAEMNLHRLQNPQSDFQRKRFAAQIPAAEQAVAEAREEFEAANAQYEGWSRFFLVQNANGHIHSSMSCSSCTFTTQFGWLTDMSGLTEADAVAAHGERLCTVCFPSAPSNWTEGYYERLTAERKAERAAAKADKAAAKAARAAKRAETVHYFMRYRRSDGEVIDHADTLRALKPAAKEARELNSYGTEHGTYVVVDANTGEEVA